MTLFFKSKHFKNNIIIKVSNSLDPDEDQCTFSPDLTPNCLYSEQPNLPLAVLFNTMDCETSDLTMWMCSLIWVFTWLACEVWWLSFDGYQVLCSRMLEVIKHPNADTNYPWEFRTKPLFLCRNPMRKTFAKTTTGERLYGNSTLCPYPLLDTAHYTGLNHVCSSL